MDLQTGRTRNEQTGPKSGWTHGRNSVQNQCEAKKKLFRLCAKTEWRKLGTFLHKFG